MIKYEPTYVRMGPPAALLATRQTRLLIGDTAWRQANLAEAAAVDALHDIDVKAGQERLHGGSVRLVLANGQVNHFDGAEAQGAVGRRIEFEDDGRPRARARRRDDEDDEKECRSEGDCKPAVAEEAGRQMIPHGLEYVVVKERLALGVEHDSDGCLRRRRRPRQFGRLFRGGPGTLRVHGCDAGRTAP